MHEIERNRSQKLGCQANGGARAGRAPPDPPMRKKYCGKTICHFSEIQSSVYNFNKCQMTFNFDPLFYSKIKIEFKDLNSLKMMSSLSVDRLTHLTVC